MGHLANVIMSTLSSLASLLYVYSTHGHMVDASEFKFGTNVGILPLLMHIM